LTVLAVVSALVIGVVWAWQFWLIVNLHADSHRDHCAIAFSEVYLVRAADVVGATPQNKAKFQESLDKATREVEKVCGPIPAG
jgi:hypothetical protein